jgi:nicotinamidase-related amidase
MEKTALLIIDIQRGAFDGVRCPPIDSPERLVDSASALLEAARAGGHSVVFVKHCDEESGSPFEAGTEHWQLHEALVPARGELVLEKRASSSFERTDLDAQLKSAGIQKLVVCGLQSEFCVSNTTRSALKLGYGVSVAGDGHSTWPSEGRSATEIGTDVNNRLADYGAVVGSTEGLGVELRRKRS